MARRVWGHESELDHGGRCPTRSGLFRAGTASGEQFGEAKHATEPGGRFAGAVGSLGPTRTKFAGQGALAQAAAIGGEGANERPPRADTENQVV